MHAILALFARISEQAQHKRLAFHQLELAFQFSLHLASHPCLVDLHLCVTSTLHDHGSRTSEFVARVEVWICSGMHGLRVYATAEPRTAQ